MSRHPKVDGYSMTTHPLYKTWILMVARCADPRNVSYANYGARGISVCDRWVASFAAFAEDMGPRPSNLYSIDRKNNDGNYSPTNCVWATKKEQALKRRPRAPRIHSWALPPASDGVRRLRETVNRGMTVVGMAKELGVSHPTVSNWLAGYGIPGDKSRETIERLYGIAPSDWDQPAADPASSQDEPFAVHANVLSPEHEAV